jgi:hypothetical protein
MREMSELENQRSMKVYGDAVYLFDADDANGACDDYQVFGELVPQKVNLKNAESEIFPDVLTQDRYNIEMVTVLKVVQRACQSCIFFVCSCHPFFDERSAELCLVAKALFIARIESAVKLDNFVVNIFLFDMFSLMLTGMQ